jgi:hypothetical protein
MENQTPPPPPPKRSLLASLGRALWLFFLAVFILLGAVAAVALIQDSGVAIKTLLLILSGVSIIGILILTIIRLLISRRFRRPALFALICLITLIALFYAEEDWRGHHAWRQFQQERAARGEKISWPEIIPPPIPDADNFALTPVVASCYSDMLDANGREKIPRDTNVVNRLSLEVTDRGNSDRCNAGNWTVGRKADLTAWQDYYRALAKITNCFPIAPQPQSPAQDVLLALSRYHDAIEDLRQAAARPDCRFPLTYDSENPLVILLPHLATMKRCARVLQLRALAELQEGQTEAAFNDVRLSLRLIRYLRTEPVLITQLVRIAMLQIALQPVWEGLADHRWSDDQLAAFEQDFAQLSFAADFQAAMRAEIAFSGRYVDFLLNHPRQIQPIFNTSDDQGSHADPPVNLAFWIPSGWLYLNQLNYASLMLNHFAPIADTKQVTFSPAAEWQANNTFTNETRHPIPYRLIEILSAPGVGHTAIKFAVAQAHADLARTAIALERFRLAHGAYPDTLTALSPQFLAELPHDVINGQPLHYRLDADGRFTLYSVGWNEHDDGGSIVLNSGKNEPNIDNRAGDWVWRYPSN